MWLVEVVNDNKQLSVSKKFCYKYTISVIKAELTFFWTSNSEGHSSHGNKGTILLLGSINFPMSVLPPLPNSSRLKRKTIKLRISNMIYIFSNIL